MYQRFFGLAEAPFSIAPDPRYLYMSRRHQEALAHLLYGLGGEGGFVLLTGEVGTGKTTVCRCLLEQIPESCDVAYIFNPKLTVAELLSTICNEFRIDYPAGNTSIKVFVDCINAYLLDAHARDRHTVLIIDEAQSLSAEVLEQMRLLTNLETNRRKLLQIVLLGQPELVEILSRAELRQLAQRIVARYHLGALSKSEAAAYIGHRLEVSGGSAHIIPATLVGQLHRLSGGIPRLLNLLCDRALLGAYVEGKNRVDRATVSKAAREVLGPRAQPGRRRLAALSATLALVAAAGLAMAVYQRDEPPVPGQAQPPTSKADADASAKPIAPVPQEAPLAEALAWPSEEPLTRSGTLAYAALFQAWGEHYLGGNACAQAETRGLRCRTARGGLDELRRLNRPAVLQLRDEAGREFFAALTALDDKSATFSLGGKAKRVALGALAAQWSGHYTAMWRSPLNVPRIIQPGERGPEVAWLSRALARVQGRRAEVADDALFDEALLRQVKQFQLAQGLIPDGAVGSQTIMQLANAADPAAPVLARAVVAAAAGTTAETK